jgi:hypothetical protein
MTELETKVFTMVYILGIVTLFLDLVYWRPF